MIQPSESRDLRRTRADAFAAFNAAYDQLDAEQSIRFPPDSPLEVERLVQVTKLRTRVDELGWLIEDLDLTIKKEKNTHE